MAENYASSCFVFNGEKPRNIAEEISLPLYLALPDITLDKMFEVLKLDSVGGIFGYAVNNNQLNLPSIKSLCRGMGLFIGCIFAGCQTQRAVRHIVNPAYGEKHVTGIQRTRSAG